MPLYEYQCSDCGHRFEVIQKFSDPRIASCPKCAGPVEKLVSSPAIQFKGSGFYLTDYGRGTAKNEGAGQGSKADGSGGGTDSKSAGSKGEGSKSEKSEGAKFDGGKTESSKAAGASGPSDSKPAAEKPATKPAPTKNE